MECSDNDRGNIRNINELNELYYRTIRNISEGDLLFVERDLAFYEKVSLSFLLFGENKTNAFLALQRLKILSNNQNDESDILYTYSKSTPNWRNPLIEALTVIGANKVLRKLGFSITDLSIIFLPHIPEVSLYIHPVLKALFIICERLDPAEAGRLILEINMNKTSNPIFFDSHCLEVYLLDWLTNDLINIGDWSGTALDTKTNLDLITQFLKVEEKDSLKEILDYVVTNVSKPVHNDEATTSSRPSTSYNENDSVAPTNEKFRRKDTHEINLDDHYNIRKQWAGFIIIINQKNFVRDTNPELQDQLSDVPLKQRRGTDVDRDTLEKTFASFGYIPVVYNDLSHIRMKEVIREFVKRSAVYDSLIICILSHGIKGAVYGINSVPVQIETIETIMAADCLQNKPKMLIIQACQERQKNVSTVNQDTMGGPSAPAYGHMLKALATIPGFASVRHIERGTWFIQTLCKLVNNLGDRKHMLDILTAVNKQVGAMRGDGNECMVPQSFSTLQKSLFLPKRF